MSAPASWTLTYENSEIIPTLHDELLRIDGVEFGFEFADNTLVLYFEGAKYHSYCKDRQDIIQDMNSAPSMHDDTRPDTKLLESSLQLIDRAIQTWPRIRIMCGEKKHVGGSVVILH